MTKPKRSGSWQFAEFTTLDHVLCIVFLSLGFLAAVAATLVEVCFSHSQAATHLGGIAALSFLIIWFTFSAARARASDKVDPWPYRRLPRTDYLMIFGSIFGIVAIVVNLIRTLAGGGE